MLINSDQMGYNVLFLDESIAVLLIVSNGTIVGDRLARPEDDATMLPSKATVPVQQRFISARKQFVFPLLIFSYVK